VYVKIAYSLQECDPVPVAHESPSFVIILNPLLLTSQYLTRKIYQTSLISALNLAHFIRAFRCKLRVHGEGSGSLARRLVPAIP